MNYIFKQILLFLAPLTNTGKSSGDVDSKPPTEQQQLVSTYTVSTGTVEPAYVIYLLR